MSGPPKKFVAGTLIWVPCDDHVWKRAEVVSADDKVVIRTADQNETVLNPKSPVHLQNTQEMGEDGITGLDDLTQLIHLHEPAVLDSLGTRFDIDRIYTYTGPILIAVNPFKSIPGLYDERNLRFFLENPQSQQANSKRIPHVFSTAEAAYVGLCSRRACQTILISGESGAGKTESTKFVMKYLALAGSPDWDNRSQIEKQVLQSNPLLEAFGNSKTLRNDNSSRFGKFIEMQFQLERNRQGDECGRLAGARIHTYLLESVRVCHQLEGERNYHTFYQVCTAFTKAVDGVYEFPQILDAADCIPMKVDLSKFGTSDEYCYLTKSSCSRLARVDDLEEFELTIRAMQTIGVPPEEIQAVYNVVNAVLRVGNLEFAPHPDYSDQSTLRSGREDVEMVALLLGVEVDTLIAALCIRTIRMKSEVYKKPLTLSQSEDTRDALARALYGTMFLKIVERTNASIGYRDDVSLFCGVLDIFGFECFDTNSFEQLCINFTNERLQQFFNTFIFKCEEEIYKREEIVWDPLDFPDNQDCVDILQGRPNGVFPMLDEECLVPQGSDIAFCNKLKRQHDSHQRFSIIKTRPDWFIINHFAGPVEYCSDNFLEKNRDVLSADIVDCVKASEDKFTSELFTRFLDRGAKSEDQQSKRKQLVTVSLEFRQQLNYLMETVDKTEPHFIRCIKPNPQNMADLYHRPSVTEQLRYGGVLQAVQVSRAGYPVRLPHDECFAEYRVLLSREVRLQAEAAPDHRTRAKIMMDYLNDRHSIPKPRFSDTAWGVGNSLVFFKHEAFEILSAALSLRRCECATTIQRCFKGSLQRQAYLTMRRNAILIQALARGRQARVRVCRLRQQKAAMRIQRHRRMFVMRREFLRIKDAVVFIQSVQRGHKARVSFRVLRRELMALKIQRSYRMSVHRRAFLARLRGALVVQSLWRRKLALRQLKELRKNARDTTLLQQQKDVLTEKVRQMQLEHERIAEEAKIASIKAEQEREEATRRAIEEATRIAIEEAKQKAYAEAQMQACVMGHKENLVSPVDMQVLSQKDEQIELLRKEIELMKTNHEQQVRDLQERLTLASTETPAYGTVTDEDIESKRLQLAGIIEKISAAQQTLTDIQENCDDNDRLRRKTTAYPTPASASAVQILRQGITNLFGGGDRSSRHQHNLASMVLLRPSLLGTMGMLEDNRGHEKTLLSSGELRPVQEVHDLDSAITYICFGREDECRDYILLAVGGKDGTVYVYRCNRTDMEKKSFDEEHPELSTGPESAKRELRSGSSFSGAAYQQHINFHSKMYGHSKAITSIFFSADEDYLVTTSVDRTVRFWSVESGDMLKVFSDSSPALVAVYLPFTPNLFVAANSNAILRLVNIQNGQVLQKLKFESEVRAMRFDYYGVYCIAGTKSGSMHVLETLDGSQLKFRFKIGLSKAAITNITCFKPMEGPPCVAVNCCDSTLSLVDCVYTADARLQNLTVKQRLRIPQSLLPLRSCFSSYGGGWLVSASEDRDVHVFSMAKKSNYKNLCLRHHQVPVLTVATNKQGTLLVSADSCGKMVLWRRFDFSHLREEVECVL